jgi:hypothetical protein
MDQSDRIVRLQDSDLSDVRKLLRKDGTFDDIEILRHSWSVCEIDDKSMFDEDAQNLATAFQLERATSFYVVRVCELLVPGAFVIAYRFDSTQDDIEALQGPAWFELNLADCLLFNLPLTCAVLRPGTVDATKFVGSAAFVRTMCKSGNLRCKPREGGGRGQDGS